MRKYLFILLLSINIKTPSIQIPPYIVEVEKALIQSILIAFLTKKNIDPSIKKETLKKFIQTNIINYMLAILFQQEILKNQENFISIKLVIKSIILESFIISPIKNSIVEYIKENKNKKLYFKLLLCSDITIRLGYLAYKNSNFQEEKEILKIRREIYQLLKPEETEAKKEWITECPSFIKYIKHQTKWFQEIHFNTLEAKSFNFLLDPNKIQKHFNDKKEIIKNENRSQEQVEELNSLNSMILKYNNLQQKLKNKYSPLENLFTIF